MKKITNSVLALIGLVILGTGAAASGTLSYQARVSDSSGHDLNGPVTVGFRIYGSLSGTTVLWGETQGLIANRGIISVELGKVNALPPNLFSGPDSYLGIAVAGDPEMAPRTRLVSTWKTMSADRLSGKSVQAGGATLAVSGDSAGSVTITFQEPFQSPPVVLLGPLHNSIGAIYFIPVGVSNITTTGCTASFTSLQGPTATGSADFDWMAIGL